MALPARDVMAALAATRFGLGARPGEISSIGRDAREFLVAQIVSKGADRLWPDGPAKSGERLVALRDANLARQAQQAAAAAQPAGTPAAPAMAPMAAIRDEVADDFLARARIAAATPAAFRERWALFWANHFTVSAVKQQTGVLAGPFEQEAIRPHVFGRFEDMLAAASAHPAMLSYLDQAQSVGPESQQALRVRANPGGRAPGLNENLAREIMELHSVGLKAGYSQADVTEFARAMTGWAFVGAPGAGQPVPADVGQFIFRPNTHQPGARTIMGKLYPQTGRDQARAVMSDLAVHPAAARHIATKLARHFVADDPPKALVDKLAANFTKTGGRLDELAKTLVMAEEAWAPAAAKFKTPYEFIISAHRAAGQQPAPGPQLAPSLNAMGQRPFAPPSPEGWDDQAPAWATPDAVVKRLAWTQTFAPRAGVSDPSAFAKEALGARLRPETATAVARAESRNEAVALLLMSPEFQRR